MIEKLYNMQNWHELTPEEVKIIARKLNELIDQSNRQEEAIRYLAQIITAIHYDKHLKALEITNQILNSKET